MRNQIPNLLGEIGAGRMSSTAYDTAWAARLGNIDADLGNNALEWLNENQLPDGSWGAPHLYYHDRVISTLAAMLALHQFGRRHSDRTRIEKGLLALEKITAGATQGLLADPNGSTVGFEMIVPTLVIEAERLGLIKRQGNRTLGRLAQQRSKKLFYLKGKTINRYFTAAFSSEMAGSDGRQMLDVENLQEKNGSVGHSPSASAYFTLFLRYADPSALDYLHKTVFSDGGMPNVAPFDVFEIAWVLWNLSLVPGFTEQKEEVQQHIDFLSHSWRTDRGVGFASDYSVQDGDDTGLVYDTLARYGILKDINTLLLYENDAYFRCYDMEVNPSISANIHILSALNEADFPQDHPSIQKILKFLRATKSNSFWVDKWHSSPYYASAHAIIACTGLDNGIVEDTVNWLMETQKPDGSWGTFESTAEETSYALQALWVWNQGAGQVPTDHFVRGREWLLEHSQPPYPPLWIGKCLYCPDRVIRSAILSALMLTDDSE
jgi:halimadienyl-diphosphate synthase